MFSHEIKLPSLTILVMIICIFLASLPLSSYYNERTQIINNNQDFDQKGIGIIDRKWINGKTHYIDYHFEYTTNDSRQDTADWSVSVDEKTYIPEPIQLVGHVPTDANLSDPANDPQLLAETTRRRE